jgi:uncharacterized membrane protein YeaQ/YmgE (transglycosylase-associated protein family)
MGLIVWIIFGLIVGMTARVLRFATTIALGVIGALLGRLLGTIFGWYQAGDPIGFAMALLGATILVIFFRYIVRRRPSRAF